MKRISELDNLTDAQIQDTDSIEVGRPTVKSFKFTWLNLKTALTTFFNGIYTTLTTFNNHKARHQTGGADEIDVTGLAGDLADAQDPKAHAASHQLGGGDEINLSNKEDVANKKINLTDNSDTFYPSQKAVKTAVDAKADKESPVFTTKIETPTIELGHADDTTLSRGAAGYLAVEGNRVPSPASQAEGDILYRGSAEWVRLAKGTASQVLAMNAGATAPEWITASGEGAVSLSDTIILEALTLRTHNTTTLTKKKEFQVHYGGHYRVTFDIFSNYASYACVYEVRNSFTTVLASGSYTGNTASTITCNLQNILAGENLSIWIGSFGGGDSIASIQNARVKGTQFIPKDNVELD